MGLFGEGICHFLWHYHSLKKHVILWWMILKAGTHLFSCIMGLKLVIRPLTKSIVVPWLPQCCKLHMYIQRLVCFLVVVPYYSHMVIRHTFLKNNIYLPKYIAMTQIARILHNYRILVHVPKIHYCTMFRIIQLDMSR